MPCLFFGEILKELRERQHKICGNAGSMSYPAGICIAASWDTSLAEREGAMLGYDARARGIHFLLAPAVNIYRSPLCGRNFEYLGEDRF